MAGTKQEVAGQQKARLEVGNWKAESQSKMKSKNGENDHANHQNWLHSMVALRWSTEEEREEAFRWDPTTG